MKINLNHIKEKLVTAGLKATHQRIVIYNALLNMNHPTAEGVFESIREENPTISLGTVYKTLDTFVENGLAARVMSEEGPSRYDFNTGFHNHIYCSNSDEIIDFQDAELENLIKTFFEKRNISNLKIQDIKVQIRGEKVDLSKSIEINNSNNHF